MNKKLHIDCANGVGAQKLEKLAPLLKPSGLELVLYNTGDGVLNHECGSDYVQKDHNLPSMMHNMSVSDVCCAMDGDADRLVYFYSKGEGTQEIVLLDGDKIAALVAGLLMDLVKQLPEETAKNTTIGVVQTAYANGNSTRFLNERVRCAVEITPTGVKHLHKAAHKFDIGIYFEANGHGTVLFKDSFLELMKSMKGKNAGAKDILAVAAVINEAVGDAISDILLVEAALIKCGFSSLRDWSNMYQDLPSKQVKATVKDRSVIVTEDAERKVAKPEGLQQIIDSLVSKYPQGRSFVRASGTEDIVRIYAEAQTADDAEELATKVQEAVIDRLS